LFGKPVRREARRLIIARVTDTCMHARQYRRHPGGPGRAGVLRIGPDGAVSNLGALIADTQI